MSKGGREENTKKLNASSLGWSTGSSLQPRKRKEILGVSAASLVALKSQVAQKREDGDELAPKKKRHHQSGKSLSLLERRKNKGVLERDRSDRLDVKTSKDRFNERQSALERKAALYDRLVSGQVHEEEAERYEVDFLSKGVAQHHHHHQEHERKLMYAEDVDILRGSGGLFSADMAREKQRREWEAGVHREAEEEEVADERRLVIEQIEKKTREERNRAEAARQERIAVQTRKRERLKAEFLKQKLIEAKKNIN